MENSNSKNVNLVLHKVHIESQDKQLLNVALIETATIDHLEIVNIKVLRTVADIHIPTILNQIPMAGFDCGVAMINRIYTIHGLDENFRITLDSFAVGDGLVRIRMSGTVLSSDRAAIASSYSTIISPDTKNTAEIYRTLQNGIARYFQSAV